MREKVLLRKLTTDCPVCGKYHEIGEYGRSAVTYIKNEAVEFEEHYLHCVNADEDECDFAPAAMFNENMMRARDSYRTKHGLLTSAEIVAIRESYGLSQVDLARLLGWGEATVSRYESKAIQDDAYDSMLRLMREDPLKAMDYLKRNSGSFSPEKYERIKDNIRKLLKAYGDEYLTRAALRSCYVEYDEPCDSNGMQILDIDKTEAVISYFAEKVKNLHKVKLMKLLWYADAVSFKQRGRAITGLVYYHEVMGAVPVGHHALMNLDKLNVVEESYSSESYMLHILPVRDCDYSILSREEKTVLDEVTKKFLNFNAAEISEYMHSEKAYIETETGDVIPFSLAAQLREF